LVGAILAGASAGRLSELFGLRAATALSGLLTAAGCVLSAAAPDIHAFLLGRLVQGMGTGWISGFSMVAIALLFPERHLARVFAAISGVWGVATLLGPLVGGLYAQAQDWRGVFWLFAGQAAAFSAAALWLLKLTGASMGFAIYGPPVLQALRGMSPLAAGYLISIESLAWTATAVVVADASAFWDRVWVRTGAACVAASLIVLAFTMADGPLAWV